MDVGYRVGPGPNIADTTGYRVFRLATWSPVSDSLFPQLTVGGRGILLGYESSLEDGDGDTHANDDAAPSP